MSFLRRIRTLFRRRRFEAELAEELRAHLEMQAEANRAAGMDTAEAGFAARRQFGHLDGVKDTVRDQRSWVWLKQVVQDLRYAGRSFRKTPGFVAAVVLVIALGIGASTAVFTGVDALVLRPLPIKDPGRLVVLAATGPVAGGRSFPYPLFNKGGTNFPFPYPFYPWFRDHGTKLADIMAVTGWPMRRPVLAAGFGATAEQSVVTEEVSGSYFPGLGVPAALGRPLGPQDDRADDSEPVAVVSYDFWRRRLNADPAVVGKTVRIADVAVTIVGVMARGFHGLQVGFPVDLWFPIQRSRELDGDMPWGRNALQQPRWPLIHILGRLRPGVSRRQAVAQLNALFQDKLAELDPRRKAPAAAQEHDGLLQQKLALIPAGTGYNGVRGSLFSPARVLMILVSLMQIAVCANVAGLLLARGTARGPELALRAALGASRRRLAGQLMTESLVLAGGAGCLGWFVAQGAIRLLAAAVGNLTLAADWRVLLFAVATTAATGVAAGLMPALRLSRRELNLSLKPMRAPRSRTNFALVAAQIAFAFILMAAAGLFARTLQNLASVDTGFQRSHRELFDLGLPADYAPPRRAQAYQRVAAALATLAGVKGVTYYQGLALLGDTAIQRNFAVPGYVPAPDETLIASLVHVGPRFFETMGIPLLRGRDFGPHDEAVMTHNVPALVISAWSARRLFGDTNPMGRRVKLGGLEFETVGVAKDVKYGQLQEAPRFVFFVPARVAPNAIRMTFVVKTAANPAAMAGGIRATVQQVDPRAQISGIRTIAARLRDATYRERVTAELAGFFGFFALVLSAMGLFGLMSYMVTRRTRELGIRLALGATTGQVLGLVARQAVALGVLGCAFGATGALALTRYVKSMLFQVSGADPATYAVTGAALLLVVLLAAWLPARRAARVDPVVALRAE